MKFIKDFVSLALSACFLYFAFNFVAPLTQESATTANTLSTASAYPDQVTADLYVDRAFNEKERQYINEAVNTWAVSTKDIVKYNVVQLPTKEPIDLDNCLFIIKVSPDDPEVVAMDIFSGDTSVVAHYNTRKGIPTISLIDGRIDEKQYKSVVMHEIGHALGMVHLTSDQDMGALMYPYLNTNVGGIVIDISSDKITKADLIQFCFLYRCNVDDLLK